MKRCFGYVRVSTLKQGEGVSLDAQKEAILAFADKHEITITSWFEEQETAAKSGRPVFAAMLKALRQHKADGVVIHKIDRSARNFADWAKIGELSDTGIDVHFASETLDFRSRGGRLSADIQAVIAADYIRNLREETKKGIRGRLKQGLYPFKAPIGYLDNGSGKPKTIDPAMAPLVREAFELYASGQHSLRSLRLHLKDRGLRNFRNKPLSKTGLEKLLGNPFYCGLIRIKRSGDTYDGIHETLIAPSLFETVQQVRAGKSGKKVTKHNHTYRGLFRCQLCKSAMIPERQKGYVYYRCQTPVCMTKCVREKAIEEAVYGTLSRMQLSNDDVDRLTAEIETWAEERDQPITSNTIPMQLAQVESRLERLTDAVLDQLIDEETYQKRKEALTLQKLKFEEMAQKQANEHVDPSRIRKFLELIKNLAATYYSAIPAEKREIAKITTSNRCVSGKNVYLEPAKWLLMADEAITVLFGAPDRPTSRRHPHMRDRQLEALADLVRNDGEQISMANLEDADRKRRQ